MTRSNYIFFALGFVSGAVCAWWIAKKHYSEITEEEIDSVKEYYGKLYSSKEKEIDEKIEEIDEVIEEKPEKSTTEEIRNYAKMMAAKRYSREEKTEEKTKDVEHPYIISPEEFGEYDDYEKISLTYYSDEVLSDEDDEILENADEVIGLESLTHFGEYEDDSVFVRNDKLKCDYEILLDHDSYAHMIREKLHL